MAISLEYYRAFYYVALYNSISRAAEEMFISQPAVSKAIKNLEDSLKCTLFVRSSHGSTLTRDGVMLFNHVAKAFSEFQAGESIVSRNTLDQSQNIYIGATESSLYSVLLRKLPVFKSEYPNVHFHISGCSTSELITMLSDGAVDFALGVTPIVKQTSIHITELADVYDVVFAHKDYPVNDVPPLTVEQLFAHPLVGVRSDTSAGKHITDYFESFGYTYKPLITVETSSQVSPLVEKRLGIGIAPMWTLDEYKGGNLRRLNTAFSIPTRKVFLATNDKYPISPLCRKFIQLVSN